MTSSEAYELAKRIAALRLDHFPFRDEQAIRGTAKAVVNISRPDGDIIFGILKKTRTWRGSAFRRVISYPIHPEDSLAEYCATEIFNHKIGKWVRLTDEILSAGSWWEGFGTPEHKPFDRDIRALAKEKGMV